MIFQNSYGKVFNDVKAFPQNITIDLVARYAAAFGMIAAGKAIEKVFIDNSEKQKPNFETFPLVDNGVEYTKFEIPGLEPLEFNAILYGSQGSIFAPPLLLGFSQEKSFIETEVNDDDPVIVERWGTKPWDIQINGLLIDIENRIYPTDQIRQLNQSWKYNGVVKVIGKQFEEKDIDTIYFRSIDFTVVEGYQDTIQFTINASSIKAVNFTLLKPRIAPIVEAGELTLTGWDV